MVVCGGGRGDGVRGGRRDGRRLLLIGLEIFPRLEGKYCLVSALADIWVFFVF